MVTPYPHQMDFIADIRSGFKEVQAVLAQGPTGMGKTVVSAYIAAAAAAKGKRVIFTVHRDNLIWQTSNTFREFEIKHGLIVANHAYDSRFGVHIASIDTLKRRLHKVEVPDLLVVDEAHLSMSNGWRQVIEFYKSKGVKILGNTATPIRLDRLPLGAIFDKIVVGPSVKWLMDNGYLSEYRAYAPPTADLSKLKMRMGDYDRGEAEEALSKPKIMGDVVAHYRKLSEGKRAVCFCVSVAHSEATAAAFNEAGIPAAHIDGETPTHERKRILTAFADGRLMVLCNVELVTTGFDLAAQVGRDVTIETVILLRPTMSLALYLQMVGRALRRKPYPAIILDHAGNMQRHGLPDDDREWTLEVDTPKKKGAKNTEKEIPPPVTCQTCFGQIKRPAPPNCPYCMMGIETEGRQYEAIGGELIELTEEAKADLRAARKAEEKQARTLEDLVALGKSRHYKNPIAWATKRHEIRQQRAREYHNNRWGQHYGN